MLEGVKEFVMPTCTSSPCSIECLVDNEDMALEFSKFSPAMM